MGVRVVVVQHGEKEALPGDPGLTANGRKQAAVAAQSLTQADLTKPIELWSSPMKRAVETAAVIGAAIGLRTHTAVRLRERMNWDGVGPLEQFLEEWGRASTERTFRPSVGDA